MAFGSLNHNKGQHPVSEINMVPLIDVMLVLLIIFMITAPLMTHAVKIDLPKASSEPQTTETEHIALSIDGAGAIVLERRPFRVNSSTSACRRWHSSRRNRNCMCAPTRPCRTALSPKP